MELIDETGSFRFPERLSLRLIVLCFNERPFCVFVLADAGGRRAVLLLGLELVPGHDGEDCPKGLALD